MATMAMPISRSDKLQSMLQAAAQSVQWTYSLFWQLCPQRGILVWGDGYYNGAIKTRRTVQPMAEVSTEEVSLQRSQQLRELYESLCAGDTTPQTRRPCAALSPEDLTESEWYYLMCASFSFAPGVGLPGKAYAKGQHVWLAGANDVDSKTFSRAILAKSACVQTVVCIPLLEGVVELGTTDKVQEDLNFIQHIKSFFIDRCRLPPSKPALSEHSTSNPTSSSDHPPPLPAASAMYTMADPSATDNIHDHNDKDGEDRDHDHDHDHDDEDEDEEKEEAESDYEAETDHNGPSSLTLDASDMAVAMATEPGELMEVEMLEDIRVGSPEHGSNNLDSEFHLLAVNQSVQDPVAVGSMGLDLLQVELPASELAPPEDITHGDTHYSETVSIVLQDNCSRCADSSSIGCLTYSSQSAFAKWTPCTDYHLNVAVDAASQRLLKYILFTVPYLHASKLQATSSPDTQKDSAGGEPATWLLGKTTPQDHLSASHMLAERRRREKLNERFISLRSLVPFVTKMDKASIVGDTIEYVKQLRRKIEDLEAINRQMEADQRSRNANKRKVRIVEGRVKKTVEVEASVQVSIIESDVLLELECPHREGLLLNVMQMLRELRIEVTGVQSSLNDGVFVAELRAKVKGNAMKKASIVEVKRALNQIIPHHTYELLSFD